MYSLDFQYLPLLNLQVLHEYYNTKVTNDLVLDMTPETRALVDQLGMLMRRDDKGYKFLYDASMVDGLYQVLNRMSQLKFSFWLHTTNPYLRNYTNLPIEPGDQILYFNNLGLAFKEEEQLLHNGPFVSDDSNYSLFQGHILHKAQKDKSKITIEDASGMMLFEGEGSKDNVVNIPSLATGKINLKENGKTVLEGVHIDGKVNKNILAYIELVFDKQQLEKLKEEIAFHKKLPLQQYKICFENRSTIWRYILVPRYKQNLKGVIVDAFEEEGIEFSSLKEVKINTGEQAYECFSNKPLPLLEKPKFNFHLVKEKRTFRENIPLPSIDMVYPESRQNDSKIFSEVKIYV